MSSNCSTMDGPSRLARGTWIRGLSSSEAILRKIEASRPKELDVDPIDSGRTDGGMSKTSGGPLGCP